MRLEIAKWRDNCRSPVLFKIDDLANIYMKKSEAKALAIGEDWGQCAFDKNSMWDFLSHRILKKFPAVKTTFFLVTQERAAMTQEGVYSYNKAMNGDEKFIEFIRYLDAHPQVELSYHGTTHGIAGETVEAFTQEWEMFKSLDEAVTTTKRGRELFKSVLGHYPDGGKYCGYKEGLFGKESIAQSGFKWWCYHEDNFIWDKNSTDKRYRYDLEFIQGVVNIPTTVDASNLSLKIINKMFTRKYLKSIYLYLKERKTVEKHLDDLYEKREVISIYEHTSPYMTNDTIQYPNIVSDIDNLELIFSHLAQKDVWYATCNELADYFIDRSKVSLKIEGDEFELRANDALNACLTITVPNEGKKVSLYDSDNKFVGDLKVKGKSLYYTYKFETNRRYRLVSK